MRKNCCLYDSNNSKSGNMKLILSFVVMSRLPNKERFSSPKFQLDRNLESCKLYSMMNENFQVLEKIKINYLFTWMCESSNGLRDRVHSLVHWFSPPQKFDNTIRHSLLKLSKYDYTYKLKCNSETLEKRFQCKAERIRRIK